MLKADAPLFAPPLNETLSERCLRLSQQVADYEQDITNAAPLELTEIRQALHEAAATIQEYDRMLTELGS